MSLSQILGNIQSLLYHFFYANVQKKTVKCAGLLLFNMKLRNPIENYPHVIEPHARIA